MALGIPNANREKLIVSIIKRESSLRKFLALQSHAESVVLDLQRNIRYTSPGEQRSHLLKELNAIINANEQNGCLIVKCFSISYQKMRFLEVKNIQQNNSFSSLNEPKTILKTTEQSYHITWNQKSFPKTPCLCKLTDILWLQSSELY